MWLPALKISELAEGAGASLVLDTHKIALFRLGGKFYAMADSCMHRGGPLGTGHIEGERVTCPWHAWDFEVKTGKCLTMEGASQKTFPVKVEDGMVFVGL
jgi:nitrite reductase (NADH) small subunit